MQTPQPRARRRRGSGWISARADGRVDIGWTGLDGAPHRRTLPPDADAERELRDELTARDRGLPPPDRAVTVGGWCTLFLELVEPSVRPTTTRTYADEIRLRIRPLLGRRRLVELSPEHVARWTVDLRAQGASDAQVRKSLNVLRIILNRAIRHERIARNVASLVDAPRVDRLELSIPTPGELDRIRAAIAGSRWQALYAVAIDTGMRQGELLALRWRDLDTLSGLVTVNRAMVHNTRHVGPPKSHAARRTMPLRRATVTALDDLRRRQLDPADRSTRPSDSGLMFTTSRGQPIIGNRLLEHFHAITDALGIPRYRWHDLRHARATSLLRSGVSRDLVGAYMGHSSANVTADLYGHLTPAMLDVDAIDDAAQRSRNSADNSAIGPGGG